MHNLELLEKRIKRSAIQAFVVAIATLAVGLLLLVGAIWRATASDHKSAAFMGALVALCGLGAWSMVKNGRSLWPARSARLYRALSEDARELAWVYLTVGSTNGIRFHFNDGEMLTLEANRSESEQLLSLARSRAPHAIFGHGDEQRQRYAQRRKEWPGAVGR